MRRLDNSCHYLVARESTELDVLMTEQAPLTSSFRVGSSFALPTIIRSRGHSPDAVFAAAGVDPALYQNPENRIPAEDLGRLLMHAADITACRDIGLLVVSNFHPRALGLVGTLAAEGPDVQTALRSLVRLLQHNTLAAYPTFSVAETTAMLGYELRCSDFPGANFIVEGSIGIGFRFLQWLCGDLWSPHEVHLSGRAPQDRRPFENFFGAPVRFSATSDAILFSRECLTRPVAREQCRLESKRLQIAVAPFSELVRREAAMSVGFGRVGAKELASQLSVSPRHFFRRLKAEGTTCQKIIDDVKYSRSQHLLSAGDAPLAEIAFALGYPDQSSFTRAFTRWAGVPPSEWRQRTKKG